MVGSNEFSNVAKRGECAMRKKPCLRNLSILRGIVITVFAASFISCAPTLAGNISTQSGNVIESSEGRINITSLNNPDQNSMVVRINQGEWSTDSDLAPGDYLVEALVPGFRLMSQKITLGQTKKVSMILSPLSKTDPTAIGANLDADVGRGQGGATLTPPKL